MAYRELTMIEVKEVLRRWQAGQGQRQIARESGVDRKTVRRYVEAAEQAGADRGSELSEGLLQEVVHRVQARPLPPPSEPRRALEPHREQVRRWLRRDGLRLTKVHELLRRQGTIVTYATLRRYVIDELGWRQPEPRVRLDTPDPGEEAQIDFGLMGTVDDPDTGRRRKLWALLVVLSWSRYMFVWPTFEQTTEAVIAGLDAAWEFFGGVPHRVVPDNTKAIVVTPDRAAPRLQEAFAEYAQDRGFYVDVARVRKPRDKARVENQVQYVRESCFAGESFLGLDRARQDAEHWCREIAGRRVHGTTREIPREAFEQREQPTLGPPPTEPFDVPRWSEAKVHPDHHIQVQRALYSVPFPYLGRTVRVRSDRSTVRVYLAGELIKMHPKKRPGERSTHAQDFPPEKAAWAFRSIDSLINEAKARGAHVGIYAERLLTVAFPWAKMREGYKLLRLCDRYGAERVDAACQRALDFDVVDVPRVERMLKQAHRSEAQAEQRGKLHKLPQSPRFARPAKLFASQDTEPEGGH